MTLFTMCYYPHHLLSVTCSVGHTNCRTTCHQSCPPSPMLLVVSLVAHTILRPSSPIPWSRPSSPVLLVMALSPMSCVMPLITHAVSCTSHCPYCRLHPHCLCCQLHPPIAHAVGRALSPMLCIVPLVAHVVHCTPY